MEHHARSHLNEAHETEHPARSPSGTDQVVEPGALETVVHSH